LILFQPESTKKETSQNATDLTANICETDELNDLMDRIGVSNSIEDKYIDFDTETDKNFKLEEFHIITNDYHAIEPFKDLFIQSRHNSA
jgi:hypothetical protein